MSSINTLNTLPKPVLSPETPFQERKYDEAKKNVRDNAHIPNGRVRRKLSETFFAMDE